MLLSTRSPVSVIIPYYDDSETIFAALESVLRELRPGDEIVIVDDAGPTPFCSLEKPASLRDNDAIRLVRQETNRGPAAARNQGARSASHPLLAFLDADDVWLKGSLQKKINFLETLGINAVGALSGYHLRRHPDQPAVSVCPCENVSDMRPAILRGRMFAPGSTLLVRRDAFLALGGYDETVRHYEDWELLLRASSAGTIGCLKSPTAEVRQYGALRSQHRNEGLKAIADIHHGRIERDSLPSFQSALAYENCSIALAAGRYLEAAGHMLRALSGDFGPVARRTLERTTRKKP